MGRADKMRNVKVTILPILVLMLIGLAGIGYGAVTCTFDQVATTVGTSDTYIRGATQNLSATLTVSDAGINATYATISAGASGCTISGALDFKRFANTPVCARTTTSCV